MSLACCAVLHFTVLCCALLCWSVLFCAALCCAVLCYEWCQALCKTCLMQGCCTMHAFVYLLEQAGRVYGDKFGLAAGLRGHGEEFWCVRHVLCILKVCQHNMQPGEV